MGFYDYTHTAAAPKAKRMSNAFELNAPQAVQQQLAVPGQLRVAALEGNYDGTFQDSTGQLDPNINSAFDYADFLVNADGKLSNDRTHPVQVRRQLRVPEGRVDRPEPRPVDALATRACR